MAVIQSDKARTSNANASGAKLKWHEPSLSPLARPSNKGETRQTWAMTALVVTKGVEWSGAKRMEGREEGRGKISCECSLGCVVQSKVRCNFPQNFSHIENC